MDLREFSLISQKKFLEITTKQEGYKVDLGSWEAMTRFSSKKSNIFIIHMPSVQSSFFDNIADN